MERRRVEGRIERARGITVGRRVRANVKGTRIADIVWKSEVSERK